MLKSLMMRLAIPWPHLDVISKMQARRNTVAAAAVVGKLVAERAKAKGIDAVIFDRGGHFPWSR